MGFPIFPTFLVIMNILYNSVLSTYNSWSEKKQQIKKNNRMTSYKFDRRDINLRSFNAVQELSGISDISLKRVVLSAPVICNKSGDWYTVEYKTVDGNVSPEIKSKYV